MKITVEDIRFWDAKQHRPKWWHDYKRAVKVSKPIVDFDIDRVVNGHVKTKVDPRYDAHNLLVILRGYRAQGRDILSALNALCGSLSGSEGTLINPKRRQGYALKWWSRIYHSRMEKRHGM